MLRLVGQPRLRVVQAFGTIAFILLVAFILDLYSMRQEVEYYYTKFEHSRSNLRLNIAELCEDKNAGNNSELENEKIYKQKVIDLIRTDTSKIPIIVGKPSCIALLEGDKESLKIGHLYNKFYPTHLETIEEYADDLQDCDQFRADRGYDFLPKSKEEELFPIAYSILIHKDFGQAERLLRNIYEPQNHYCFHVDSKADKLLSQTIRRLNKCLPNVFLVSKQEKITYASIKRLQAEINCMSDLLFSKKKWKYFINLTGQAFPLKTNRELVKILTYYNGANDIEGKPAYMSKSEYLSKRWLLKWTIKNGQVQKTGEEKNPAPRNISIVKGSAYGVFSREFVEYALTDELAIEFLKWSEDTYSPDEFYWSSMHHKFVNPMFHSPGGYSGAPERKPWLASYSAWNPVDKCYGEFIRSVCVFGIGDLPNLLSRKELFANKFYWHKEPLAVDCLEEWLRNKTQHYLPVDAQFYKSLPFIQKEYKFVASKAPGEEPVFATRAPTPPPKVEQPPPPPSTKPVKPLPAGPKLTTIKRHPKF